VIVVYMAIIRLVSLGVTICLLDGHGVLNAHLCNQNTTGYL
jgi:hypothetical protein